MNYKLEFVYGSLKATLYYPDLRQAVEYLRDIKRRGGYGRVYRCGNKEEVVAS